MGVRAMAGEGLTRDGGNPFTSDNVRLFVLILVSEQPDSDVSRHKTIIIGIIYIYIY
jgi:hypothetical protein